MFISAGEFDRAYHKIKEDALKVRRRMCCAVLGEAASQSRSMYALDCLPHQFSRRQSTSLLVCANSRYTRDVQTPYDFEQCTISSCHPLTRSVTYACARAHTPAHARPRLCHRHQISIVDLLPTSLPCDGHVDREGYTQRTSSAHAKRIRSHPFSSSPGVVYRVDPRCNRHRLDMRLLDPHGIVVL